MKSRGFSLRYVGLTSAIVGAAVMFQNCSQVAFQGVTSSASKLDVCNGISCNLDPLTDKPAVTTILIALGDQANNQLVVSGASSQLIAESVIRYSSPVKNPKILLVQDFNIAGEDPEDTVYIQQLLSRYNVTFVHEPEGGLTATDLVGYDLIWFNNPGHPMSQVGTRDTLLNFAGAVVLQGDDLTQGAGFSLEALTGLKYIDNGTSVMCNGASYKIDNNLAGQYSVTLDSTKLPGANSSAIKFNYGNDIDLSEAARPDLEVLAVAKANIDACTEQRPAIVRWTKTLIN